MQKIFMVIVCLLFSQLLVVAAEGEILGLGVKSRQRVGINQDLAVRHLLSCKPKDENDRGFSVVEHFGGISGMLLVPNFLSEGAFIGGGLYRNFSGSFMQGEDGKQDS